jgi:hypothetical protein
MSILANKVTYLQESSAARPALSARTDDWWTVMAWRGNSHSDNLSVATVNLKNDMEPKRVDRNTSQVAPALTFFRNRWWMVWVGDDGERSINIGHLKFGPDGESPEVIDQRKTANTSLLGPALTSSVEALYLAWVGRDATGRINIARSTDGLTFTRHILDQHTTRYAPTLAYNQGKLYLAYTAGNDRITMVEFDNPVAAVPTLVKELDQSTRCEPSLAPYGRRVALAWTGQDGDNKLNVAEYESSTLDAMATYEDSASTGPSIASRLILQDPHSNVPPQQQLIIAWAGTDGAGTLNVAISRQQDSHQ